MFFYYADRPIRNALHPLLARPPTESVRRRSDWNSLCHKGTHVRSKGREEIRFNSMLEMPSRFYPITRVCPVSFFPFFGPDCIVLVIKPFVVRGGKRQAANWSFVLRRSHDKTSAFEGQVGRDKTTVPRRDAKRRS